MQRAPGSNPRTWESSASKSSQHNAHTLHTNSSLFSVSRPLFGSGVGSGALSTSTSTLSGNGPLLSRHTLDALSTITSSRTSNTNDASSFSARNPEFTANNQSRIAFTAPNGQSARNTASEEPPRKYMRTLPTQPTVGARPLGLTKVLPINKTPTKPSSAINRPALHSTTKPFTPVVNRDPLIATLNNARSTAPFDTPETLFGNFFNERTHGSGASSNLTDTNDQLRKSVGSSALDFARKSLMQHATTTPQEAIRRVSRVAADSHGTPSIADLMTAPDVDVEDPIETMAKDKHRKSFARPNEQFTFESTPLPAQGTQARLEISHSHGVLDLSQSELRSSLFSPVNEVNDPSTSGDSLSRLSASQNRSTIWEDAHPSTSAQARTRNAPYKVLSINERESLRAGRKVGFRARPLDPRVFTSAGDLGVPRIKKLPLTVPVSPVFSKPRIRHVTTAGSNAPKATVVTNISRKTIPERRPGNRLGKQNSGTPGGVSGTRGIGSGPNEDKDIIATQGNVQQYKPPPSTTLHRFLTTGNRLVGAQTNGHNLPNLSTRKLNLGPPQRQDSVPLFNWSKEGSTLNEPAPLRPQGPTTLRRPLTLPVPFRFATDEILRKKTNLKPVTYSPSSTVNDPNSKGDKTPAPIKRNFPQLKRITSPHPFRLATQLRAEMRQPGHLEINQAKPFPSTSRLAMLASTNKPLSKPHFVPTVPISPKLGRQEGVRRFKPPVPFLAKKSTKELTEPHEFHFHSDERAKQRDLFEQSIKRREIELAQKERSAQLEKEREERRKTHEQLEKKYRARPIKHYQPIVIHKATRPLTKPVSPMIGEKRKRHEMEMKYQEQQQEREQWEARLLEQQQQEAQISLQTYQKQQQQQHQRSPPSQGQAQSLGSSRTRDESELYPQYEMAKILQEQQKALKDQLVQHELKQLDLANSTHASIHQPPIRLSFPLDPEIAARQANPLPSRSESHRRNILDDTHGSDSSVSLSQLPARVSESGNTSNNRISNEHVRVHTDTRRVSGDRTTLRPRLSDARQSLINRASRSLEGGKITPIDGAGAYFPFSRSLVPSAPPVTSLTNPTRTEPIPLQSRVDSDREREDRRRSGSFVPMDQGTSNPSRDNLQRPHKVSPLKTQSRAIPSKATISTDRDERLGRSGVVIEHTLTLSDLNSG